MNEMWNKFLTILNMSKTGKNIILMCHLDYLFSLIYRGYLYIGIFLFNLLQAKIFLISVLKLDGLMVCFRMD